MKSYHFSIVTPEGTVFDDDVESVVIPGSEGYFGVLSDHAPIASSLTKGVVQLKKASQEKFFAIDSGIFEMNHKNECLLLSNTAEEAATAEEARQKLVAINP